MLHSQIEQFLEDGVWLGGFVDERGFPIILHGECSEVSIHKFGMCTLEYLFIVECLYFGVMGVVPNEPWVHEF